MIKIFKKQRQFYSAFTLLEVVVSLGILGLAILALFTLIPTGSDQTSKGHQQAKAILLAQSKIEELLSLAAEDWDDFNSFDHKRSSKTPHFIGPWEDHDRPAWGWEKADSDWVPDLGFQWEWHFVNPDNVDDGSFTNPPFDGSLALISLTVSWPQQIMTKPENVIISGHKPGNKANYFLEDNIQHVRLVSYVSEGL